MQMFLMAPGLSQEVRLMTSDIIAEEMMGMRSDWEAALIMDPVDAMDSQYEALVRARERMATVLDEEELRHIDNFTEQMQQQLNIQGVVFELLFNRIEGEPGTEQ